MGWRVEEEESFKIMDKALDLGINCFDTADVYSYWADNSYPGKTEEIIGRWLKDRETRDDLILQAFITALDALERFFETDDISKWVWGEIHQLLFWHISGLLPFDAGPFPGDGTGVTLNPSGTDNFYNGNVRQQSAMGGASERMIIDFANFSNSLSVLPSGQRGISTSKHYIDQLEQLFLNGEYHYTHFDLDTPEKIKAGIKVESRIYFRPGGD